MHDRSIRHEHHPPWYRLDNAALIMSLASSTRLPYTFRLSVTLKSPIRLTSLEQALENTIERFPYYRVSLKRGFFWYYWDTNLGKPKVIGDSKYPGQRMPITQHGILPFRVRAYQNRIAVEFHHSITDGTGGLIFLRALTAEYLRLNGIIAFDMEDVLKPDDTPDKEEGEDAFKRYFSRKIPEPYKLSGAFQLPFGLERKGVLHITTGIIPLSQVLDCAKKFSVTLTELLAAVYLDSLQEILFSLHPNQKMKSSSRLRLMVPVNIRKFFPSKTMRNFFLWVSPGIDPRLGKYQFEDIVKEVHHQMRVESHRRYFAMQIKRNVAYETNPLIRIIPLFLKRIVLRVFYRNINASHSGVLTNLGAVSMPAPLSAEIEDFQFLVGPTSTVKENCAVASYLDKLYVNFLRVVKEPDVDRYFFRKLVSLGMHVKIETN